MEQINKTQQEMSTSTYRTPHGNGISPSYLNVQAPFFNAPNTPAEVGNVAAYYSMITGIKYHKGSFSHDWHYSPFIPNGFRNYPDNFAYPTDSLPTYRPTPGYIEALPARFWCRFDAMEGDYFVLPEIDCVGYRGIDPARVRANGNRLRDLTSRALNILPSIYESRPRTTNIRTEEYGLYVKNYTTIRMIRFDTMDNNRVFVSLTERDFFHLYNSSWLTGLQMLEPGYTLLSNFVLPSMKHFDGYRFWKLLYNFSFAFDMVVLDRNFHLSYCLGSVTRLERNKLRKYHATRKQTYSLRYIFQDPIKVQGLFWDRQNQSEQQQIGLMDAIRQIGEVSQTINGLKGSFDSFISQDWIQCVIKAVSSIALEFQEIINAFTVFSRDPASFCEYLKYNLKSQFSTLGFNWYDTTKGAILLVVAYHLYNKSKILSVGLAYVGFSSILNCFFESTNISRICTIMSTMCFLGVMTATQLTPAVIQLQGDNSLPSMIYATTTAIILGFGSAPHLSSNKVFQGLCEDTKNLFQFSRGTLTVSKCIEFIITAFNKTISFVFGDNIFYKAMVKMSVSSEDLKRYIEYSLSTQPDTLASKLTLDADARKEWEEMCKLHMDFIKAFSSNKPPTETHIGYSMYSKAALAFLKLKDEYDKISDSLQHFRSEPFMIWIYGEPGTGKTAIRDVFVNHLYRWHKKIDPMLVDAKKTGLLYVRNPADKYLSKYNGQFAMGYDDVGQNRQADNPEFNEIMAMGSINQVRLNMAELGDKGKMFSSKVVIMAANSSKVAHNNLILKPDAFNRRRHVVLEMSRPFLQKTDNLVTSKANFGKLRLVVRDSLNPDTIIKSFPEEGFGCSRQIQNDFFKWLAPKYVQHVKSQKEFIDVKQTQLDEVLNSTEANGIVDIDENGNVIERSDNIADWDDEDLKEYISTIETDTAKTLVLRAYRPTFMELYKILSKPGLSFSDEDITMIEYKRYAQDFGIENPTIPDTCYDLDYEWTEEEQQGVERYWKYCMDKAKENLKWIGFASILGTVASAYGVYRLFKSFNGDDPLEIQKYELNTKAPQTNKVVIQTYSLNTKAPKSQKVLVQEDQLTDLFCEIPPSNLEVVHAHLEKSFGRMYRAASSVNSGSEMNCFNIAYNYWMVPRHFFPKKEEDRYTIVLRRQDQEDMEFNIPKTDIIPLLSRDHTGKILEKDLCLVHLKSLPHGKNHIRHFATQAEIENVRNFNGRLLRWNKYNKRPEVVLCGMVQRWDIPVSAGPEDLYYSHGYSYNYETSNGDCGGLLTSADNTTNSRIYGIHFGLHMLNKRGMSFNVMREELQDWINTVVSPLEKIEQNEPIINVQEMAVPKSLLRDDGTPYFEYLGYVHDGPSAPRKHKDLFRSPLFDRVYEKEKDLSVLTCNDPRLAPEYRGDPDILTRGVIDYAYESKPWPEDILDMAQACLTHEYNEFEESIPRKVQTQDWALNGTFIGNTRLEHTEPLNLKTSAGYGLKGTKMDHFARDDNDRIFVRNPILQQMIDNQWNAWMAGETYPTIWANAVKSETLKLSKIYTGNSRTFCVAQTCFLVNMRRLFGSFTVAMKNSKIKSFSCLGVDSFSAEWNDLYNNLRKTGPNGIDMDFFKFDRTAVTWQLAKRVCESINKWYDDDIKFQRARLIAFQDLIFSYTLIGKHLVRKNRGNPSGNPLTTELNNSINYLLLAMVYFIVAREHSPENFSILKFIRNINMKTYGDDIMFTVQRSIETWFTPQRIEEQYKKYGVPVTPADKSENGLEYKPLEKLTFLKCEFLPFDHPVIKWQAGLSKTSIRSMIQFYRLKPNQGTMMDAVQTNCYESLKFAYHWGQEFWEQHYNKINDFFKENDLPLLKASFMEYDIQYRAKLE